MIRFPPPPPFVHALSFSLEETGTDQMNPIFWGLHKAGFGGGTLQYVPPPPPQNRTIRFGPPFSGPKILRLKRAKMLLCPFRRSHREICTRNRPVCETKFLDDFCRPLSLPAPLFYCWHLPFPNLCCRSRELCPVQSQLATFAAPCLCWLLGFRQRGSFQRSPMSWDSREVSDSGDSRLPKWPDCEENLTVFWDSREFCYGAQNDITHAFFIFWELPSQLHKTSVTQGFLARICLCNWAPSRSTFHCEKKVFSVKRGEAIQSMGVW